MQLIVLCLYQLSLKDLICEPSKSKWSSVPLFSLPFPQFNYGSHQIWNQKLQFCWQVEPGAEIFNNSRMKIDWRCQEEESTAILMQVCSTWWNAKMHPTCPPCSSAVWGYSCSAEKQPYAVSCQDQQRYDCISTYSAQLQRRLLLCQAKRADCCHPRLNPLP